MKLCLLLSLFTFGTVNTCENHNVKGDHMAIICFEDNFVSDSEDDVELFLEGVPIADEKGDVERIWNTKIPDDFFRIGGDMLYGWIKMCRHDNDPEGVFRGEYIDKLKWYKGFFRYKHPEGKQIPKNVFSDYYLSHFSSESKGVGVYSITKGKPPVEYFYLQITNPEDIKRWDEPR